MTALTKLIKRTTSATILYRGEYRSVILSFVPPCYVGVRLKGCKKVRLFPADHLYWLLLKADVADEQKKKVREKAERKKARRKARRKK